MNKKQIYVYLSNKYGLPYKYIKFKLDNRYLYKYNIKLTMEEIETIEKSYNWDYMKEDYEKECNIYSSIFYIEK